MLDLEQVLASRLECDLDGALTPSLVATLELGNLLGRSA
jgi:hypothetical protein